MKHMPIVRVLFSLAAAYDGVLGVAFLGAAPWVFERFEVTPPNHYGYVHFAAAILLVFTLMFLRIAIQPTRHRNLIVYGVLLKVCYVGVVGYHWLTEGIPWIWQPFVIADAAFAGAFVWAYWALRARESASSE